MVIAMRRAHGFTLTEMIVVLMIVGALAVMGFPAMTRLLSTQAVRSASYDLYADLIYARSEAVGRGVNVTIVGVSGTDFKQGWNILELGGNTTLRTQSARSSAINFTSSANTVTFDRNGRASAAMSFNIVPTETTSDDNMKRCIRLDPSGRPKTAHGACV